jgi:hypothetical protein
MRRALCLFVICSLLVVSARSQETVPDRGSAGTPDSALRQIEENLEGEFGASEIAATSAWVEQLQLADWLGPLAPIAISPFFGVTCLSGLAIWGPESIKDNALLGSAGPLQSTTLFFVFLALTVLTSLPRLTKVSKIFSQAADQLETYAVIIILLAIKIIASTESSDAEAVPVAMIQMGVFQFTLDALVAIAMVINILVINSVKFFFEFLVWLTPIPTLDAIFELCNKALCAALMAVYAVHPALATLVNLVMLLAAALVLRWVGRRVLFYRTMMLDPLIARLWPSYGEPARPPQLIVYCQDDYGPFKAKSRLRLQQSGEGEGLELRQANWWMPAAELRLTPGSEPTIQRGWVTHTIKIENGQLGPVILHCSRRYDRSLDRLAVDLGLRVIDSEGLTKSSGRLAVDLS